MSWIEKSNTDFTITCGDGRSYTVGWLNATLAVEWNAGIFEFNKLKGTMVKRKERKGNRYNIEVHFQGEDHLDVAEDFRLSADNPAPWVIQHPYYGQLTVQPTALLFDNTGYNITKITGTVIETITEEAPVVKVSAPDKIIADTALMDTRAMETFNTQVQPATADLQTITANNTALYNEGKKGLQGTLNAEGYTNAFNTAQSAVNKILTGPSLALTQIQAFINYPVQFQERVSNRLQSFANQLAQLRNTVENITTRNGKKIYEFQGATLVGGMALTTVTNITGQDYNNRTLVTATVETLLAAYNGFIEDLEALQSLNGGDPGSYIPDFDAIFALTQLVNYTVGNLFSIADNSRQERALILEEDTNPISLAHRLYGLLPDDSTIQELMDTNNIVLLAGPILKKGRRIVYYV